MTPPASNPIDNARKAIQGVLSGNPPNGIVPEHCGKWAEVVRGCFDGYSANGTAGARRAWEVFVQADKQLARLVAADEPKPGGWGGVLPFHSADLPAFPLDIFPKWLRDYCEAVTETMQTPPDLSGMLALSVLSTACARRAMVHAWHGWIEPVNVYTVTSLTPGNRKSAVFRVMTAPLIKFEQSLSEKIEGEIMRAEAERDILKDRIEAAKRKTAKTEGEYALKMAFSEIDGLNGELKDMVVPSRPKLIVDDVTPETVATILAEQDGRLAILSPEGDIFGIMAGRYTSGPPNIGVYLKAHAGDAIRVDRRGRSEYVKAPALTMGITTQPEVMRSFGSNDAFRGQGLLARFFYALPKSTVGARAVMTRPIADQVQRDYFRNMMRLLEYMHSVNSGNIVPDDRDSGDTDNSVDHYDLTNIYYINISPDGITRLVAFAEWIEPQIGPYGALAHMSDWAAKLSGAVCRVAGLLHLAECAGHNCQNCHNPITEETIERAIRFARYLIPHASAAYAEIGADPSVEGARAILRWIEKNGVRTFAKRECYRGVKGPFKRADDCEPALALLVDHNYIREQPAPERDGVGRKPSPTYEVNPIVLTGQISQN